MNYQIFSACFKNLCLAFDLDFDKKKDRIETYYNSKLGEMTEEIFSSLIKQAKETLSVRPGFLPPIRELVNLYYTTATNYNRPRTLENSENWEGAICPICNGIGLISEDRPQGRFIVGCCKCIIGQKKQHDTKLGRELGCYENDGLSREVPF